MAAERMERDRYSFKADGRQGKGIDTDTAKWLIKIKWVSQLDAMMILYNEAGF